MAAVHPAALATGALQKEEEEEETPYMFQHQGAIPRESYCKRI
jgi:hypothetical protein